jgi:hypothetical protein
MNTTQITRRPAAGRVLVDRGKELDIGPASAVKGRSNRRTVSAAIRQGPRSLP